MRWRTLMAVTIFSGCVVRPVLVPVGARGQTFATADSMGVRLSVDGTAWRGDPGDLSRVVTPVRVTLENRSGREVRVGYDDFTLVGDGFTYRPLAPLPGVETSSALDVPQVVFVDSRPSAPRPPPPGPVHPAQPLPRPRPPPPPRHPSVRFYVAPHYRHWWPHPWVWVRPFPHVWTAPAWSASLPTDDMIAEALPEGVLQDGGRVEGFLYFRGVAPRESRVTLRFELTDANSEQTFGALSLPLLVR